MDKASPGETLKGSSSRASTSKSKAPKDRKAMWARCKQAVEELRQFRKFLQGQYASPGVAFDKLFERCSGAFVGRDAFTECSRRAGFQGDAGLVFDLLKDAEEGIAREGFIRRLKAVKTKPGQDFMAVVELAVAAAALKNPRDDKGDAANRKSSRGRSQSRSNSKQLTRKKSKESIATVSTRAPSTPPLSPKSDEGKRAHSKCRASRGRAGVPQSHAETKIRQASPSPPCKDRKSRGRSPEPRKRR